MLQRSFSTGCIRPGSFHGHGSRLSTWLDPCPQHPTQQWEATKEEIRAVHCLPRKKPSNLKLPTSESLPWATHHVPRPEPVGGQGRREVCGKARVQTEARARGAGLRRQGAAPSFPGQSHCPQQFLQTSKETNLNTNWEPHQNALQGHLEPFLVH